MIFLKIYWSHFFSSEAIATYVVFGTSLVAYVLTRIKDKDKLFSGNNILRVFGLLLVWGGTIISCNKLVSSNINKANSDALEKV